MKIIKPMLAKQSDLPRNDTEYGFEIKWDGMRAILYYQDEHLQIMSRNQKDVTAQYPELNELGISETKRNLILDGEIVHLGQNGQPSFSGLQHRMGLTTATTIDTRKKDYPVTYIIFDLLSLHGESTMHLSYTMRREILDKLQLTGPAWQTPAYKLGSGQDILKAASSLGLEGIVAKRLSSIYVPGKRTGDWLKIKNHERQELVIGGFVPGNSARRNKIGALLLGYYNVTITESKADNQTQQLIYAGKAGTGFTSAGLEYLGTLLSSLIISHNPFNTIIPDRKTIFVRPVLVGEFEFTEWTSNNTLRHPVFKGLRTDKQANEVIREHKSSLGGS
ncbi:MAG: polymerase LigD, ligase domain protein [Firmicutes bacterium]|nr:polymerase LigD, ligase domain protein [Bacillota bacterium]